MNKTTQIIVAAIVVVVIVAGSLTFYFTTYGKSSGNGTTSSTSFTIGDFGISHPDAGAYAWMMNSSANEKATLMKYDQNIKLQDFPGGSGAVSSALTTGKIQVGMLSADGALNAIAKGVPIKIVSVYRNTPYGAYIYVSPNSTITSPSQLNNATFANSKPGSLDVLMDELIKAKYNLSVIHNDYLGSHEAQQAAVIDQTVNASTGSYFDVYKLIQSGNLKSIGTITEQWPGFVVVALNSFISAHPNAVKAAIQGMDYGNTLFNQNKSGASYTFMKTFFNFTASETGFFMHSMYFSQNGTIYKSALSNELTTLQGYSILPSNLTLSQLYTSQFVSVSNAHFNPSDPSAPWKTTSLVNNGNSQLVVVPEAIVRLN